ncbi:homocysteine-responsive endoplasmic reticulum-resident ubiquitin-like domain member 2 protein isoform X2 [Hydractinia symbiolongicarpus]|uniref:homocysteine-responsive endoplasmic reticulum-resident ubiquitin-like domain member 2 protein isoform X2 n=1 Tax=Hydractinia symbiolongicarpus TaxID=13093 RepID=UPI00255181E9|nr:homocysteine-responsive endoplasmic reticulum-resident ubiquitin-like domain member 2 protein isoform X2 [Hydractinia symbiolongicarpus]
MESLIKLTVKTPNQRINDIQIDCDIRWTVRKLKEYLQDVYPSKPASSSQKLIYLGKLLQDHHLLKEVFGEWGTRTLHLVCSEMTGLDECNSNGIVAGTSLADPVSSEAEPTPSGVTTTESNADGLRYRGYVYQSVPGSLSEMNSPLSSATSMPDLAEWYQHSMHNPWSRYHMHMQQYYQHWQQWHNAMHSGQNPYNQISQGFSMPPSRAATTPNVPLSPGVAAPQEPPQELAPQEQQQAQPGNPQNENIRMNAGVGGPMVQEDEEENDNPRNRDWLDWLYMSLRLLMFLSIIYFYSSTSRFLMVTILGFIVYLYQGGWFTPRRRVEGQPDPVPEQPNQQDNENVDFYQENTSNNNQNADPPRPSAFRILCTFFVSFVTSIIPTVPEALQQP